MSTNRIKLVVAYDGTDFCGWAAQAGRRTVQGTLTEAVRRVSGEEVEIVGASRTDSGAHATGQVCHFDATDKIEPTRWAEVVNRSLPRDLAVVESRAVAPDFNSRFCAVDRRYRYRILIGTRDPIRARFSHWHHSQLDLVSMREVAKSLVGYHDFRAFTEELDPTVKDTRRKMFEAKVDRICDELRIEIRGTAFLRGMMRRMAGLMFEVGKGQRPASDVKALLGNDRSELMWPVVLPASGLTLVEIRYGRHPKDHRKKDSF